MSTKAFLTVLTDPFKTELDWREIDAGSTVLEFVEANATHYTPGEDQPIIVVLDGDHITTDMWATTVIGADQRLVISPRPQGLDPLTWFYIVVVAITVAVAATSMVNLPDDPAGQDSASPSYNVNAQGNSPRLGDVVPDRYGRWRAYPDWAAKPYREYEGHDEYLYQAFSVGQGSYEATNLKIGNTDIASFDDVTHQMYEPGQVVDLFRPDVYTAPEVGGQGLELFATNEPEWTGWLGPFVANAAGTTTDILAIDLQFPRGLNRANDDGGLSNATTSILAEYREIDGTGAAVGSWTTLANQTYTQKTVDTLRYTLKKTVASGRYEVRARRSNATDDTFKTNDQVMWVGLRSFLVTDATFEQTVWVVKAKATSQLSGQSERKFNGEFTRKLPMWNGAAWTAATATRNPMWAYANILKAEYGGDYTDANLNLPEIKAVADVCDTRGDYFDGQFDKKSTLWSALKQVTSACRAHPMQYGDSFSVVRDDGQPAATYMFNGRNTTKPIGVTFQTMDQWADDSVEIEYTDPTSWKPEQILCAIPGTSGAKPKKVKMPWITDAKQAHREGMFLAAKYAYRTVLSSIDTELEGMVPQYLDGLQIVSHYMNWGTGGEITAVNGQRLTLSEPVTFTATDNFIYLRADNGASSAPLVVAPVAGNPEQVDVTGTLPSYLYTGNRKTKTFFAFADNVETPRSMLVDDISRSGDVAVKIRAVLDDPRVHQFDAMVDNGTVPTPAPKPPVADKDLTIAGFTVVHGGTVENPEVKVSWNPNGKRYFVEYSYDAGVTWEGRQTVTEPTATLLLRNATVDIRVAAQDENTGAWYQVQIHAGSSFSAPETPNGLQLIGGQWLGLQLGVQWTSSVQAETHYITYSNASDPDTVLWSEGSLTGTTAYLDFETARLNGLGREIRVKLYGVNSNNVASATPAEMTVKNDQSATVSGVTVVAGIEQAIISWTPPTEPDHKAVAIWASRTPGFTPGLNNLATLDAGYAVYQFPVGEHEVWYFKLASHDMWGFDELNYSAQKTVTGVSVDVDTAAIEASLATVAADLNTAEATIATLDGDLTTLGSVVGVIDTDLNAAQATLAGVGTDISDIGVALNLLSVDLGHADTAIAGLEGKFPIVGTDITDGAVSTGKIAANAITAGKIATNAITAGKIVAGAVSTDKLAANSVTAAKIVAGSITADELAANSVTSAKIVAGSITADELAANSVNANKIVSGSITADELAANSVTSAKIIAGAVSTNKIAANAITAGKVAADAIEASAIKASAVTVDKLAANSVTAAKIVGGSITGDKLVANTVTSDKVDTRNLTIKDAAGNVIFGSGQDVDYSRVGGTKPPANADVTDYDSPLISNSKLDINPNLLPNPTGLLGDDYWTLGAWAFAKSSFGLGSYFHATTLDGGTHVAYSDLMACSAGSSYTLSADLWAQGITTGAVVVDLNFLDANLNTLLEGPEVSQYSYNATFSATRLTSNDRNVAPAGTVYMRVRVFSQDMTATVAGVRRIKVERGNVATAFVGESTGATIGADASNLNVGVGVNLVPNAAFTEGLQDISFYKNGTFDTDIDLDPSWTLENGHTVYIAQPNSNTAEYCNTYFGAGNPNQAVTPDERLEASVYVGSHRCTTTVGIMWLNAAGGWLGNTPLLGSVNEGEGSGGSQISGYKRIGGFYTVPHLPGIAYAMVYLQKLGTDAGSVDSYMFATRPFLARAMEGQTVLSEWSPGATKTNWENIPDRPPAEKLMNDQQEWLDLVARPSDSELLNSNQTFDAIVGDKPAKDAAANVGPNLIFNPELGGVVTGVVSKQAVPGWSNGSTLIPTGSIYTTTDTGASWIPPFGTSGTPMFHCVNDIAGTNDGYFLAATAKSISVDPTKNYCLAGWFRRDSLGSGKNYLRLRAFGVDGANLGTVPGPLNGAYLPDTKWNQYASVYGPDGTAFPAGTSQVVVEVYMGYKSIQTSMAGGFTFNEGVTPTGYDARVKPDIAYEETIDYGSGYITGTKPPSNATHGADSTNLAIGSGNNLLPNSGFINNSQHTTFSQPDGVNWGNALDLNSSWTLKGGHTYYIKQPDNNVGFGDTGYYADIRWDLNLSGLATVPGQRYEVYSYIQVHRCAARMYIFWYDEAGSWFTTSTGPTITSTSTSNATIISRYTQTGMFTTAPTGAVYARVVLRKLAGTVADTDSYLFVTRPYFGNAFASQTEYSPWSLGYTEARWADLNGRPAEAELLNSQQTYGDITGTKPPADADKTSSNTSAGFAGQTAFATLQQINAANISTYIAGAAIDTARIKNAAITNALIGNLAVGGAQIQNAAITNAKIGNLAVDTAQIAGQAVTVPVGAYTAARTEPTTGWTAIQSVTLQCSGAPVNIQFNATSKCDASGSGNLTLYARIMRGGTVVHDYDIVLRSPNGVTVFGTLSFAGLDTPPAGLHTYTVQMYYVGTKRDCEVFNKNLLALELKK